MNDISGIYLPQSHPTIDRCGDSGVVDIHLRSVKISLVQLYRALLLAYRCALGRELLLRDSVPPEPLLA